MKTPLFFKVFLFGLGLMGLLYGEAATASSSRISRETNQALFERIAQAKELLGKYPKISPEDDEPPIIAEEGDSLSSISEQGHGLPPTNQEERI